MHCSTYTISFTLAWYNVSLLALAGSIFALRTTAYYRQWSTATFTVQLVALVSVVLLLISNIWTTIALLFALLFVKPFTDKLGYEEPRKFGNPLDDLLDMFRDWTRDPVMHGLPPVKVNIPPPLPKPVMQTPRSTVPPHTPPPSAQHSTAVSTSWLEPHAATPEPPSYFQNITTYTIVMPKGEVWDPGRASAFMTHMLRTMFPGNLTFQVVGTPDTITWRILDIGNHHTQNQVVQAIRAYAPATIDISISPYQPPQLPKPFYRQIILARQAGDIFAPIRSLAEKDIGKLDPLTAVVNHMSHIPTDTQVTYTMHTIAHFPDEERQNVIERTRTLNFHWLQLLDLKRLPGDILVKGGGGGLWRGKFDDEAQEIFDKRLKSEPLYSVMLALQFDGTATDDVVDEGGLIGIFAGLDSFGGMYNRLAKFPDEEYEDTILLVDTDIVEQRTNSVRLIQVITEKVAELSSQKYSKKTNSERILKGIIEIAPKIPLQKTIQNPVRCGSCGEMNELGTTNCRNQKCRWHLPSIWQMTTGTMVLNPQEMALLWHLPHSGFTAPEIQWISGGKAPDELTQNTSGVIIGDNNYLRRKSPVYFTDDHRRTGMHILGKPGMGKSTYMHNLIHQDIERGYGVAVIDPHGKLVEDIIGTSIPAHRKDDLIVIDIDNETYPAPLNPLVIPGEPGIATGRFMAALNTAYNLTSAERAMNALKNALTILAYEQQPTLIDIVRLFEDPQYRQTTLQKAQGNVDDFTTMQFWDRYNRLSADEQDKLVYPIVHRLQALYGNKFLYPMLCHPQTLDVAKAIREKKIVLVSLHTDRDKVPEEDRNLIGSILVSIFEMGVRKSFTADRTPFYLYIDEVQNFVTTSIGVALTEARKFGLSLHIANQYLGQLKKGDTLEAILGAIGSMVVFQVGADDARELAKHFSPVFQVDDFVHMKRYNAAVKTTFIQYPPFSIETRMPPSYPQTAEEKQAAQTRNNYLRNYSYEANQWKTRQEVIDWLHQRYRRNGHNPNQSGGPGNWTAP